MSRNISDVPRALPRLQQVVALLLAGRNQFMTVLELNLHDDR